MKLISTRRPALLVTVITLMQVATAEPTGVEFGRIFLTPAERLALDKKRTAHYAQNDLVVPETPPELVEPEFPEQTMQENAQPSPRLIINGFVQRHGTSGTVWINGESSYDGDLAMSHVDHLRTKIIGRRVRVAPLDTDESVYLKPGQVYEPTEQVVSDAYSVPASPSPQAE